MPDWQEAPLEHFLTRLTYGFTNPMPTTSSGPYMITARDINGGHILYEQARSTSQEAFRHDITDKSRPDIGDVLVTKDGTLGRIAVVDRENICINQSVALLKPSGNIRSRFLKYLLEAPVNFTRMLNDADGSTISHIYITRLAKMIVRVPSVELQDDIVTLLGALDDKIDLNRRINQTLEAMARAIYKDWFVDFGPTRSKAEGRDRYLAPDLWDLFPDRLDNEKKPAGWERNSISSVADIASGKRPSHRENKQSTEFPIPLYGGAGPMAYVEKALYNKPILLTGRVGTLGIVHRITVPSWPSDNTLVIIPKNESDFDYSYYLLKELDFLRLNRGSTQPLVTQTDLKNQAVIEPPREILDRYSDLASALLARADANRCENGSLAKTRDLLLPKLMSSEIRLRETERTEAAL